MDLDVFPARIRALQAIRVKGWATGGPPIPLTADRAREAWDYDAATGQLIWKIGKTKGKVAGCARSDGYRIVRIDYWNYQEHRVVWLWMTGAWPENVIDHIDRNPGNNRWTNLRDVPIVINAQNAKPAGNKYGLGVRRNSWGRFEARIFYEKKRIGLGTFDSPEAAQEAYLTAKTRLHPGWRPQQ